MSDPSQLLFCRFVPVFDFDVQKDKYEQYSFTAVVFDLTTMGAVFEDHILVDKHDSAVNEVVGKKKGWDDEETYTKLHAVLTANKKHHKANIANSFLLCGSEVVQQRELLNQYFPSLQRLLHFRTFELSNITTFFRWYKPELLVLVNQEPNIIEQPGKNTSTIPVYEDILLFRQYAQAIQFPNFLVGHSSSLQNNQNYVLLACDIETSDKEPAEALILEIALVLTDVHGCLPRQEFSAVVHWPKEVLEKRLSPWCKLTHERSGLLDAVEKSTLSLTDVQTQCCVFLKHALANINFPPVAFTDPLDCFAGLGDGKQEKKKQETEKKADEKEVEGEKRERETNVTDVNANQETKPEVDKMTNEKKQKETPTTKLILFGSNTPFDLACLTCHLPKVAAFCKDVPYFDVSVPLMFFSWIRPEICKQKPRHWRNRHRALSDIQDSLNLLAFYSLMMRDPAFLSPFAFPATGIGWYLGEDISHGFVS